jgi:hypothetical protein
MRINRFSKYETSILAFGLSAFAILTNFHFFHTLSLIILGVTILNNLISKQYKYFALHFLILIINSLVFVLDSASNLSSLNTYGWLLISMLGIILLSNLRVICLDWNQHWRRDLFKLMIALIYSLWILIFSALIIGTHIYFLQTDDLTFRFSGIYIPALIAPLSGIFLAGLIFYVPIQPFIWITKEYYQSKELNEIVRQEMFERDKQIFLKLSIFIVVVNVAVFFLVKNDYICFEEKAIVVNPIWTIFEEKYYWKDVELAEIIFSSSRSRHGIIFIPKIIFHTINGETFNITYEPFFVKNSSGKMIELVDLIKNKNIQFTRQQLSPELNEIIQNSPEGYYELMKYLYFLQ